MHALVMLTDVLSTLPAPHDADAATSLSVQAAGQERSYLAIGIALLFSAFFVYLDSRIIKKAGFSRWYALLVFVPVVNAIMFIAFAFVKWPIEDQLHRAKLIYTYPPQRNQPGSRRPARNFMD